MNGCTIRVNRLLAASGRSVMIAFDHGGGGAPASGEDVPAILDVLATSDAQGVLLGPGMSRQAGARFARPAAPALVTALDAPVFSDLPGEHGVILAHRRVLSARRALGEGATAAKVLLPLGHGTGTEYADSFELVARATEEAHEVGLPVMVEPALWGRRAEHDDAVIAHSARVAWELGADMIKIHAPADTAVLGDIVDRSEGPVFVLGGSPASAEEFLVGVDTWIAAGAAGVVVGRNVWGRPDPASMVRALSAVVHDRDLAVAHAALGTVLAGSV